MRNLDDLNLNDLKQQSLTLPLIIARKGHMVLESSAQSRVLSLVIEVFGWQPRYACQRVLSPASR